MKSLLSMLMVMALMFGGASKAFSNSCTASVDEAKAAQDLKVEAKDLRAKGDYAGAAAKYEQAADSMPMTPVAASYLMNAVGCLLGTYDAVKGYRWHDSRGPENAQAAYKLLDRVDVLLKWCEENKCECSSAPVKATRAWYNAQLKWLKSQVDRK